jgi:hypothetical protein
MHPRPGSPVPRLPHRTEVAGPRNTPLNPSRVRVGLQASHTEPEQHSLAFGAYLLRACILWQIRRDLDRPAFLSLDAALSWHACDNTLKRPSSTRSSRPHGRKDRPLQPPNLSHGPPPAGPGPCQASERSQRPQSPHSSRRSNGRSPSRSLARVSRSLTGVGRDMVQVRAARVSAGIRRALSDPAVWARRESGLTLNTTAWCRTCASAAGPAGPLAGQSAGISVGCRI